MIIVFVILLIIVVIGIQIRKSVGDIEPVRAACITFPDLNALERIIAA